MTFKDVINSIDEPTYLSLKRALEIGKWPDGRNLSEDQKALTMQAVIAYEIDNNMPDEERTGYIDSNQSSCETKPNNDTDTLKWQ